MENFFSKFTDRVTGPGPLPTRTSESEGLNATLNWGLPEPWPPMSKVHKAELYLSSEYAVADVADVAEADRLFQFGQEMALRHMADYLFGDIRKQIYGSIRDIAAGKPCEAITKLKEIASALDIP